MLRHGYFYMSIENRLHFFFLDIQWLHIIRLKKLVIIINNMNKHKETIGYLISLIITVALGIFLGCLMNVVSDQQVNKVKTIKAEPEIKIIKEEKTGELIYYQCKNSISNTINPWSGDIAAYPSDDFIKLVDQCVNYSSKDIIN
jgi:hypothetical protein